jgi:hypothetical protein
VTTDNDRYEKHDRSILEQLLQAHGIYTILGWLAEAVRKQGKERVSKAVLAKDKAKVKKLSEEIARNIEKARDAT